MTNIPILYEDNHLLIVEKPVNIPVQEDRSKDEDLLTILKKVLKVRYNKLGNVYLGLVHRLDRPVGGVIVFAKTSKAASRLAKTIQNGQFTRKYLTVVRGIPKKKKEKLTSYLVKDRRRNIVYTASKDTKNAKIAILEYEVLQTAGELSILSVQLHTGRSHQIRVQLSTAGYPIYGDQKYGNHINKPGQQIALWAHSVQFKHPVKDEMITVQSQPPEQYPWNLFTVVDDQGREHLEKINGESQKLN